MEIDNPVYQSSDNEKPPLYEYRSLGRSLDGVTSSNYHVSTPSTRDPMHPKAAQSLKCIWTVLVIAIVVNLLLLMVIGGVLYYYHERITDIEGGGTSTLLGGSVGGLNNSGPPGPPGLMGPKGDKGPQGSSGVNGLPGLQGPSGHPGITGPPGQKGDAGPQGDAGVQGLLGPAGAKGQKGDSGPQGMQGLQGAQGLTGTAGATGPQGQKGSKGSTGATGSMGAQGDMGVQGPLGPAGATGPQGQKGEMGSQGAAGAQGIQGPVGPPGAVQGGVTYTRWGSSTCPSVPGTQMVYTGYTAGSFFGHSGSGANYICTHSSPQYGRFRAGFQNYGRLYGSEYEAPIVGTHEHNVPCAVCLATTRGAMYMFPARNTCPTSWTVEYTGWLMTERLNHARSMYVCVDQNQESFPGSGGNLNGALLYHVEVDCGYGLPCPPYIEEKEVLCAVCTK